MAKKKKLTVSQRANRKATIAERIEDVAGTLSILLEDVSYDWNKNRKRLWKWTLDGRLVIDKKAERDRERDKFVSLERAEKLEKKLEKLITQLRKL